MSRNKQIATYLEPPIYAVLQNSIIEPRNTTVSSYLRALVIKDLDDKNLLPSLIRDAALLGIENLIQEIEAVA